MTKIAISGIDVDFPYKPYAPQIAMMCKIINALKKKENALIESPTGTGKTLALLCAALAWQKAEYKNVEKQLKDERDKLLKVELVVNDLPEDFLNDDDDFVRPVPKKSLNSTPGKKTETKDVSPADLNDPKVFKQKLFELRKCVPKIYFCSRTHKQLVQVIRELNRTSYRSAKMTILGSREQTCINQSVQGSENRNEACKSLLKNEHGMTCMFYQKLKRYENNASQLRQVILQTQRKLLPEPIENCDSLAWDIEDIVKIGEDQRFCPYFATTNVLMQDADLIFCPYNYLIDPLVREKVKVNTHGQIILLDEAHNIEDSCRDATSFSILENDFADERDSCEAAGKITLGDEYPTGAYQAFAELCSNFLRFLKRNSMDDSQLKQISHGTYCKIWSGTDILAELRLLGVTEESYVQYAKYEKDIYDSMEIGRSESRSNTGRAPVDDSPKVSMIAIEQVLTFCRFLFRDNSRFIEDFKMGVMKQNQEVYEINPRNKRFSTENSNIKPVVSLKIWCLNPAVAFSDIGPISWSIVLASGTLSPLDTFESELGIPFRNPYRLEAAHVLSPSRMFVRSIGMGPHNKQLRATHQIMFGNEFLDELGSLLLDVCDSVPRGVLCFLPSYKFLETIQRRWSVETGLWSKLEEIKRIFIEPKDNISLKEAMTLYYEIVDNPSLQSPSCTGALFLAVYRGKISEGLDFADDYARIVVTVGIPYPNFKQIEIEMKREYNDKFCTKKKLLNGRQWYEIQAYRALNQALGRCLRHKNDWGSLLLVDERFFNTSTQLKLSKWIRGNICHSNNFDSVMKDLRSFTKKLSTENENEEKPNDLNAVRSHSDDYSPLKLSPRSYPPNFVRSNPLNESFNKKVVHTPITDIFSHSGEISTVPIDSNAKCLTSELRKRYSFIKQNRFTVFNDTPIDNSSKNELHSSAKQNSATTKSWFTAFDPSTTKVANVHETLQDSPIFIGKSSKCDSFMQQDSTCCSMPPAKRKLFTVFQEREDRKMDIDCWIDDKI